MTGSEAWQIMSPLFTPYLAAADKGSEAFEAFTEAYVITFGALKLYDSWTEHGKPQEWEEKPKEKA